MRKELPSHAKVAIIGGGVIGCATAYHLTKLGVKDVVVLERRNLTCGTTWAAAGLVVILRGTPEMVRMTRHGYELYRELEKESEHPTGFIQTGTINIATNEHRKNELELMESLAESFGVVNLPISMEELRERWPLINTEDVLSAYYMPNDAVVNPVDTAMSLAAGARKGGVQIFEDTEVVDFELKDGQLAGIKTTRGELKCESTVLCAGMFDVLMEAGRDLDVKLVGLHAVDSLRLERGFRHWPSDIDPDSTPLEAGLQFAVKFDKGEFWGKETLLKQKREGLKRKLVMFTVDDAEPLIYHDEPIYRDGELVSSNTHGAYGHLLDASVGMCYLQNVDGISDQWITQGHYEIGINSKRYPISIHLNPPYDPKGKRVRM